MPTPAPTAPSGPFMGSVAVVPGTIEVEEFDYGGEGIGYHDTSPGNSGGVSYVSIPLYVGLIVRLAHDDEVEKTLLRLFGQRADLFWSSKRVGERGGGRRSGTGIKHLRWYLFGIETCVEREPWDAR